MVLDDGRFELLLIPNPKNVVELQNLIWALLNQQYDTGGLIFRHVTNIHVETMRNFRGRWTASMSRACPVWTSPTTSAP